MEERTLYIINIGDFSADGATYTDRCLSASFGGNGVSSEVIPWEGTEYNPWDYRAVYEILDFETEVTDSLTEPYTIVDHLKRYTGEFVLEPIMLIETTPEPTQLDRIEAQALYTALLTDTLLEV